MGVITFDASSNKAGSMNITPKDKPSRKSTSSSPHICSQCQKTESKLWRRGPDGESVMIDTFRDFLADSSRLLCNACGLRWRRSVKAKAAALESGPRKSKLARAKSESPDITQPMTLPQSSMSARSKGFLKNVLIANANRHVSDGNHFAYHLQDASFQTEVNQKLHERDESQHSSGDLSFGRVRRRSSSHTASPVTAHSQHVVCPPIHAVSSIDASPRSSSIFSVSPAASTPSDLASNGKYIGPYRHENTMAFDTTPFQLPHSSNFSHVTGIDDNSNDANHDHHEDFVQLLSLKAFVDESSRSF